jgi:hypothetical protein
LAVTSVDARATLEAEPAEVEQLDSADLEQMGIDTSTATDEWRIEKFEDGTYRMVFGPGAPTAPVDSRAVAIASGNGSVESAMEPLGSASAGEGPGVVQTQALAWYCDVNTYFSTVLESSTLDLRTAYDVDCYNVARHRVDWKFQRSSWSGYRDYTNWVIGGWLSAGNRNAQTIRTRCWGGGTYDYRGLIRSVVEPTIGDTRTSPSAATLKTREPCGTGVS